MPAVTRTLAASCVRAASYAWTFALLAALMSCSAPAREVLVVVRVGYPNTGATAVDRYQLRVYRRASHVGARWRAVIEQTYYLPFSPARNTASQPDSSAVVLPENEGRHLLRPESLNAASVLIEAQAGLQVSDGTFFPTGLPAVAQFGSWPEGRGRIELSLSPLCLDVDAAAVGAYRTCVANAGESCPRVQPACVRFAAGGASVRETCDDDPEAGLPADGGVRDSGAATMACPHEGAVAADAGGIDAGDAGTNGVSMVATGGRRTDCGGFEVCGRNGRWSRCVRPGGCFAGGTNPTALSFDGRGVAGAQCCVPPVSNDCEGIHRESSCGQRLSCVREICESCGTRQQQCCADEPLCRSGEGECVTGNVCACGGAEQPCCGLTRCNEPNLRCVGLRCVSCGGVGSVCCNGDLCNAGARCSNGRCGACGGTGQPCCAGDACTAAATRCLDDVCTPCGGRGEPCCVSTGPGTACEPSNICQGARCVACGATGQVCCAGSRCETRNNCSMGECVTCGRYPGPCCTVGPACDVQFACTGFGCICHGPGEPCGANACCLPGLRCSSTTSRCCAAAGADCTMNSGCCSGTCTGFGVCG